MVQWSFIDDGVRIRNTLFGLWEIDDHVINKLEALARTLPFGRGASPNTAVFNLVH